MNLVDDIKLVCFLDWLDSHEYDISRYLHEDEYREMIESEYSNANAQYEGASQPGMMGLMRVVKPDMSAFRDSLLDKPQLLERYKWDVYKCILLCDNANPEFQFSELLFKDTWHDLNSASGQFLDIFYEQKTGGARNGYSYIQELSLDIDPDQVPCIVLWKKRIDEHITLSIKGLSKVDILSMLIKIATLSKKLYTLDQIKYSIDELQKRQKLERAKNPSIVINNNNTPVFNNNNTNTNKVAISIKYDSVINAVGQSALSDADKLLLKEMLSDIEQLKKTQKDKSTIWEKVKSVFGWIADKAVDVGLALTLVPYLSGLIL